MYASKGQLEVIQGFYRNTPVKYGTLTTDGKVLRGFDCIIATKTTDGVIVVTPAWALKTKSANEQRETLCVWLAANLHIAHKIATQSLDKQQTVQKSQEARKVEPVQFYRANCKECGWYGLEMYANRDNAIDAIKAHHQTCAYISK